MARLRPVDFEDRLTLVEHLDELRTRIIISIVAFTAAFALCFWQNSTLLDIANAPLPGNKEPITFGVAEPFTTTVTISAYAAIVISLPVILYQAYAFVLPALTTREKRVVVPFLLMVPLLFIAGVVFGYFVVLPAATKFLLNFNDSQFNIQIRARDYYSFFTLTLGVMGLIFQLPVGILAVTRLGIITPEQLSKNRRYAYVILLVVAALLPGTDPVTMLIEAVPLIVLFEASVLLAKAFGRPQEEASEPEIAVSEPPPSGAA
ncbi:MAG TPA: twin-arginine translocase subunit TatC [Solirubrobacterales bacterium]|jgi:sec-independent protein translocase protein TatC|nr:twin-arginine translocase subunit TatC [Solirubrobacterales bacterium]